MKTREQIYGQEAASILRDISMYRVLTEGQLFRLYPGKQAAVRNLLGYLVRQGRICQRDGLYCAAPECAEDVDRGLLAAVWVLVDFIDRVEYHAVGEFPAKIIFIADGEVYEIVHAQPGKETLLAQIMGQQGDEASHYLVLVDDPEQIGGLELPHVCGYCTVSPEGEVQYYQKE